MKLKLRSPVNGDPIITSPYGPRVLNGMPNFHDGIDFVSAQQSISNRLDPKGTDVYSMVDGVICFDYDKYDDRFRYDIQGHNQDSAGNMVIVQSMINGATYFIRYLHLVNNVVTKGQIVKAGEKLGMYADVGYSFGPHVHIDIYLGDWSRKIDPTPIIFEV